MAGERERERLFPPKELWSTKSNNSSNIFLHRQKCFLFIYNLWWQINVSKDFCFHKLLLPRALLFLLNFEITSTDRETDFSRGGRGGKKERGRFDTFTLIMLSSVIRNCLLFHGCKKSCWSYQRVMFTPMNYIVITVCFLPFLSWWDDFAMIFPTMQIVTIS